MSLAIYMNGIELSWTEVCIYAAETGDLLLLELGHKYGGNLTSFIVDKALEYGKKSGNYECYEYIYKNKLNVNNLVYDFESMTI